MNKVATTDIGRGINYALVPARLVEFQEKHPRSDIKTEQVVLEDGAYVITTTIKTDQAKPHSKGAQGSARYSAKEMEKPKAFEKLATISLGRCLSNLGYLNDGKIAGSEEMDEYNSYTDDQIELAVDTLNACNSVDELKATFLGLGNWIAYQQVIDAKDKRKAELQKQFPITSEASNEDK